VVVANGNQMNIYVSDKEPILFEFQGDANIFPTVYFTWLRPACIPILLIQPPVMEFIEKGADLMLPGLPKIK
jgi:translation initiation factor 2D